MEKPKEYAARGIPEFWQVDPSRAMVTVLKLEGGAYQAREFRGSDLVVSHTFRESAIDSRANSEGWAMMSFDVDSFVNGFWQAFGGVIGGATGTIATCYAVDVLIAPVAPPAAAYLAAMCPAIGATVTGVGGAAGATAIVRAY